MSMKARALRAEIAVAIAIVATSVFDGLSGSAARAGAQVAPAGPIPHGQAAAPNAPRSPPEAARAMTVPAGFEVEVVAAEPDIINPVAMTFDERGRVWITESIDYPRRAPGPGRDRVKVLEDTNGDGKADRFTTFAQGLNIPSGIAVGHGGVWVANSPDILFLEDRDGDGKAERREVVATGFGRSDTHELPNSLTWGPDGWLYGWNGVFNPSKVVSKNGRTYAFTCAIFRIHPRTRVFEVWCEGTSNPWGIAIDEEGSFFASACVIDHLWHLVETGYYHRQGGPYPPFTWPIGSIVDHTHQKAAYCGIHYFDSPAYPAEYRGRLYMGNIHGNCINVDVLERNGSTYRARPAADFLRANDAWFMPVAQQTGPDGCLYVLDWYDRYHCYQDANRDPAGIDRQKGRLYRVRYKSVPRRAGFDLAGSSDDELIKLLGSRNVYERDIAQRLLCERGNSSCRRKLEALVLDPSAARTARMHALWVLIGAGLIEPDFHLKLLNHTDAGFRAWAVRAAGNLGQVDRKVRDKVVALARDSSPDVKLQVGIAARKIVGIDAFAVWLDVLADASSDPLLPQVAWQNLHPSLVDRQVELAQRLERATAEGFRHLLPRAIDRILASSEAKARVIAVLLRSMPHEEVPDVLIARLRDRSLPESLEEPLRREIKPVLKKMIAEGGHPAGLVNGWIVLLAYCGDTACREQVRGLAISTRGKDRSRKKWEEMRIKNVEAFLSLEPAESIRFLVAKVLAEDDGSSSIAFRGKVLDSLGRLHDPGVATTIVNAFASLPAELKPHAIEVLSERAAWSKVLLAAILDKRIPASVLNINEVRRLQKSPDPEFASRVKAIWGTIRDGRNPKRERVAGQIRKLVDQMQGDPLAGHAVFKKLCADCHRIYGEGQDVGPEITLNGRSDFEQLLSNVFDPSLVIGPGYEATTLGTVEGRVMTGLLIEDGKDRVVLKLQGGTLETVRRSQIDELKTSAVSLMPEEIEKQLAPQEIADLLAFLCLDKPPTDPTAKPLPGAGAIVRRRP
jgi:putative heme-binding domain-containing protein